LPFVTAVSGIMNRVARHPDLRILPTRTLSGVLRGAVPK
jgi:hypothetical protein